MQVGNEKNLEQKFSISFSNFLDENKNLGRKFAVGVSGGADSLALVLLLKTFSEKYDCQIVALTVDHQLREDSLEEANYVAGLMKKHNIEHHILTWQGEKPKTGVEEAARKARYNLLQKFCEQNGIENLLVAHHKVDQAETLLIRLQRGSGVDGLSGMSEQVKLGKLNLIRPLLEFMPQELKTYLYEKNIVWKEDSLNESDAFLRVRVRKFLPELEEKIGLTVDRLYKTTKVLGRARDYLEKQTDNFIKNNVSFLDNQVLKVSMIQLKNQHEEILFRVLAKLLKDVAKRDYIPESEQVERVCSAIYEGENLNRTLAGCELICFQNKLWILPEQKDRKIIEKKKIEFFLAQKFAKIKMPYKAKKFLFMKSIEF